MKQLISLDLLDQNTGQIEGLPSNPRQWTQKDINAIAKSLKETPELFDARPIIVIQHEGRYVILGGNLRYEGCRKNRQEKVPCYVMPTDTPVEKLKEIVVKDNGSFGQWDYDALANEWDSLPLTEWGVPAWNVEASMNEAEEIERKRREFEERMKAGEISEEDEEYQEFLDKFKLAKTTDDCYTPEVVYDAVAEWVSERYNISRRHFVRPFYPGGDYIKEEYPKECVVVDNPPFSILAEIIRFYAERHIRFFLFAPALTLFSSSSSSSTAICTGAGITYENKATVNTSFLTNLEPRDIRIMSAPSLYARIKKANEEYTKELRRELPRYSYDKHVITSSFIGQLSHYGIDFAVRVCESKAIDRLDMQKESGKAIYGKGYLVSDNVVAEREKAEREKAEREKAERWELSDRERRIVKELTEQGNVARNSKK